MNPNAFDARMRVVRVLWMALVATLFIYIAVLVELRSSHTYTALAPPHLRDLVFVTSVAMAVLAIVIPRRNFSRMLRAIDVRVIEEPGEVVGSFRESAPVRRVIADPKSAVIAAFTCFQQPFVLGMALAEAIALFGFLLGYFNEPTSVVAPFFAGALLIMITKFPRLESIIGELERAKNATCDLKRP